MIVGGSADTLTGRDGVEHPKVRSAGPRSEVAGGTILRWQGGSPTALRLEVALDLEACFVDYRLVKEQAPADSRLLMESVERARKVAGEKLGAVVSDRGYASAANSAELEKAGTFDALCPRSPEALEQRMKEKRFRKLQKRRAQTEARIGILKANFLGQPMRPKGFENRELALAWGVLTHNLWVLARMRKVKKAKPELKQAA